MKAAFGSITLADAHRKRSTLEYNARFGIRNTGHSATLETDLLEIFEAVIDEELVFS